jgi:hypothetical protein
MAWSKYPAQAELSAPISLYFSFICSANAGPKLLLTMKNKISLLLLFPIAIGISCSIFAQEAVKKNPNAAKIKFETEVIDYGTIPCRGDGNREFKFTNVGKEPLILSNVQSSCGCLVPTWPKEPIGPGKSAVIKAHYDTGRVGNFEKTLTVTCNDPERPTVVIRIKGKVLPPPEEVPAPDKKDNGATPLEKH